MKTWQINVRCVNTCRPTPRNVHILFSKASLFLYQGYFHIHFSEIYTNKTHLLFDLQTLVFCVWLCLVSLQVKTQPPVILLHVHGYWELSYFSCLLINKQANPIGSLFFLNHFRNQLWEPKFLRKQNTRQRPHINISSNSGQYENTGKQRWDTGMTNCQGWPTATWTLVHDELWWDLATQQAQPLNLVVFLHPTWSLCHYSERNWWGWWLQIAPKAFF